MNVYLPWRQLMALRDTAREKMDYAYSCCDWSACDHWMAIYKRLNTKFAAWKGRPLYGY